MLLPATAASSTVVTPTPPDMAAVAAFRHHPGHHFRQLVRDHSQNDHAHMTVASSLYPRYCRSAGIQSRVLSGPRIAAFLSRHQFVSQLSFRIEDFFIHGSDCWGSWNASALSIRREHVLLLQLELMRRILEGMTSTPVRPVMRPGVD
jgi:hypothetical protein